MGQIKNIKLHIVTDIKDIKNNNTGMSDQSTPHGYEYDYDEDFDDEGSADENNNDRDSGMFEGALRAERSNSLETTEFNLTKTPKKNTGKPGKTYDPYKVTNPTSRRAQSDPRGRKPPPM